MESQPVSAAVTPSNNLMQFAKTLNPTWELDDWFDWPPDLFALTSLFLKRTGAYRYAVAPPVKLWPEGERWDQEVTNAAWDWRFCLLGYPNGSDLPLILQKNKKILKDHWRDVSLDDLISLRGACYEWDLCRAMLELHALADSACGGFGHPSGGLYKIEDSTLRSRVYGLEYLANMLLATTGSLSRLPKNKVLILPKMRTPRVGITLRSLSHYVTMHESEVEVAWRSMPWINSDENTINIMVVPWPYEMNATCFKPESNSSYGDRWRPTYFRYTGCDQKLPVEDIVNMVKAARRQVNRVHAIVFPELALTKPDLVALKKKLAKEIPLDGMPMLITGLRSELREGEDAVEEPSFDKNQVVLSTFFAGRWYDLSQDKHHRWKLDEPQIQQYNLGGVLIGKKEWWESIDIPPRRITFLAPNGWLALCPLICEDLARLDPVSDLIRGVGPTLLIAILLDGPQLQERWPGRYASVLADDPGTSVLTVSSLGMAERSLPPDRAAKSNRTVALWKDLIRGWNAVELREGEHALLLTVAAAWTEERTADGRGDGENAGVIVWRGIQRLRVPESARREDAAKAGRSTSTTGELEAPPEELLLGKALDIEELTRFTFLVDAALDTDDETLDSLSCLALGRKNEKQDWLKEDVKAGNAVCELIAAGIRKSYEEQSASPDRRDPAEAKQNFGVFVDWLIHVLKSVERDRSDPFNHWNRLIDQAETIFLDIRQNNYLERLGQDAKLYSIIKDHGGMIDDRRRVKIYTVLSLLWAIHNRLAYARRHGDLTAEWERLLKKVEKLLAMDYLSVLQ